MARRQRPGRSRIILVTLILASLVLITFDFRDTGPVHGLRSVVSTVLSPLEGVGSTVATPFRNAWHGAFDYNRVKDENAKLRARLDKIKGNQAQVDALRSQNRQLRRAADIKFAPTVDKVGAQVMTGPLSNFDQTIRIDVGSGEGIRVGMPVATNAGLIGKVVRVFSGQSVVQLLSDPNFEMGVRLNDAAGDVAVAHGTGKGQPIVIDGGIPYDRDIPDGTDVFTSGTDRSPFPPDVPVGKVKSTKPSVDGTEKSVTITPAADLTAITYVQVMLYEPPS